MNAQSHRRVRIIGGGAAGYFAALACAEANPDLDVVILEAAERSLQKVRISGGGRCNVTASCFDPAVLVEAYPRGGRELRGAFSRFQPEDTMVWFESRGVSLKTEADGRVFPVSDRSESIVDCLTVAAKRANIQVRQGARVQAVHPLPDRGFEICIGAGERESCGRVLIATGSGKSGYDFARACGHTIVPCVPSLFSFAIDDPLLTGLQGVSFPQVNLRLDVEGKRVAEQEGAALITHWGLSGPAVIRLSAWGARELAAVNYHATLHVNWLGGIARDVVETELRARREISGRKAISRDDPFGLPKRFWAQVMTEAGIDGELTWANLSRGAAERLSGLLTECRLAIRGKGEFKEEFVTCGGVSLTEVDFRTMESKICPGLYFAGEVLDVDGITGGYNFQSAWTTGWIAGQAMAVR